MELRRVQTVCVCLGVLGFIAGLITCAFPSWTINFTMTDYRNVEVHMGLWMVCFYKSIGDYWCVSYDYMNTYTEVACGLTVTCCVVSAFSLLLLLLAACKKSDDSDPKRRWAAVGFLVSSLLLVIPVSLTASDTVSYRLDRRELGVCMYTGWLGGSLLLLAGVTLCCCSCRASTGSQGTAGHRGNEAVALGAMT